MYIYLFFTKERKITMENVLNEKEVTNVKVRKEASQKAMIALVTVTGLLCLGVVGGVIIFSTIFNTL